jgi:DNA-binding SARP family transcriptional activator
MSGRIRLAGSGHEPTAPMTTVPIGGGSNLGGQRGESIRIQLLGPVRAWRDDKELVLGPPKQRAVLGVLASRANDVVGVEQIIDAVWGSDIPQSAANGVHTYVAGLRRALEPGRSRRGGGTVLISAAGGYSLRVDPDAVDASVFIRQHAHARRLRTEGNVEMAVETCDLALSLWRGEAYAGIPGPFAATERTLLQDLRLTAVEEWTADMLHYGRHAEVVPVLSGAVSEEPLREKLRWLQMMALYRCGRQADAMTVYWETRKLLGDELGIEPGVELRELYQRILTGHPDLAAWEPSVAGSVRPGGSGSSVATPQPNQLPPSSRGFVGRSEELSHLTRLFKEQDPRLGATTPVAVIDGTAGVGKTAFALELAHRLAERYPDGQLFVDLCGTNPHARPVSAADALLLLLRSLDVDEARIPADLEGRMALYRSLLYGRRMLVVLDDARGADQLRPLIPRGPSCVLTTSRQRQSGLIARDGAHRVQLGPLAVQESMELLIYLIGTERLAEKESVALRLARLCGHLPLALRVAAEALVANSDVPLASLVERYAAERGRFDQLTVENDDTASLRTAFEMSYKALPAEVARLFRLLGLYRGRLIDVEVAATLAGTSGDRVRPQLETLVDNHLLEETSHQRYRFHDLVGIYAAECAESEPLSRQRAALERLRHHRERKVATIPEQRRAEVYVSAG